MNKLAAMDTSFHIFNLQTLQREVSKEGDRQIATICKLFVKYDVPDLIEKLKRLEAFENGSKTG